MHSFIRIRLAMHTFVLAAGTLLLQPLYASECLNCMDPGGFCSQGPLLELQPGPNLYWHDPNCGFTKNCQTYPADALGCQPRWFASAETLMLFRDTAQDFTMATLGPQGPSVLGTSAFDAEFDAGLRATVGMTLGDWYRVELSYFGSNEWSDSASVRNTDANDQGGNGNLYSPFSNFGNPDAIIGSDYNNFASISFRSTLNNAEVNLRRRVFMRPGCYECSFLFGGRYMQINESFSYLTQTTQGGANSVSANIRAENEMYGLQIGLQGQFLVQPRYWIDFGIKGAIMSNDVSQRTAFSADDGATTNAYADSGTQATFVGELTLQVNYQLSRSVTVYAGYNAFWVTGAALAADNFVADQNILTLGPADVDHAGEVVYHGPNIGLVFVR